MRRLLPLLLLPLTACSLSSDPAADSVGKAAKLDPASGHAQSDDVRRLLPPDPKAETLTFTAPATEVVFEPKDAKTKAGVVNIRFTTEGAHNFTLDGPEGLIWGHPAGAPADVTHAVEFEPGTYRFLCSVPGHDSAGMVGSITVA